MKLEFIYEYVCEAMPDRTADLTNSHRNSIIIKKQGDYCVVEKVKPAPLNLLANTNVGS